MSLFWRRKQTELQEELDAHLRMSAEDRAARGEDSSSARRSARRELGNSALIEETTRDQWGFRWLEVLLQDLRYAFRMLRKSPGFTTVAVLTLALGIGANTAIFSIVDAVLLRALPFKNPSRLVMLHEGIPKMGYPKMDFAVPDLNVFLRAQNSFSAVGVYEGEHLDVTGRGEPERISAARVSASLLPVLGVEPVLGRNFSSDEDVPGHPVAIVSYPLWQRHFGGATDIIGRSITLDRHPYEIIGVMPRNFAFPIRGEFNGTPADVWVPMAYTPDELQDWGGAYLFGTIGRLKPGVTLAQARADAVSAARRIIDSYPAAIAGFARNGGLNVMIVPLQQDIVGSVRPLLLVLMAAVSFVLLIACANIATLLLSRAASRSEEIAVRTALGATRLRLLRQFFTESLVLSLVGGALGLFLASWVRDVILTLVPPAVLLPHEVPLSKPVLAFALGVSILSAFLFGLAPAFQVSSFSLQHSLRESGGAAKTSRRRFRLQGLFVTAEFALALVLLIASGLLIRSFAKLLETNPGFRPEHVLTMSIPLPRTVYSHSANVQNFYVQLLDKVSNLPGVQDAGISSDLPLGARREMVSFTPEGQITDQALAPQAICQTWVMGNYLETMGVPLLKGRWFTPEDRSAAQQVAVVSEFAAKKFWPGQEPLGKRLRWGLKGPWQVVVGVVGNVKEEGLDIPFTPQVYRPYLQMDAGFLEQDPFGDGHARNLNVRTAADPASLTSAVMTQIHSLDSQLAVANISTMTQVVASSVAAPKFNTLLLGAFAGLALFLAAIGVYGVLAYSVAQQTHDIGIRIALGAQPRDVMRMILKQGARVTIVGIIIGLLAAFMLTRLLSAFLYGVTATDPLTFTGVTVLLLAVALTACYIPARRAMRVDPMVALRYE